MSIATIDRTDDVRAINKAWDEEGSISRLGMRPRADKAIQDALIPPGGDWKCVFLEGGVKRSIVWQDTEAALINPRGDMGDLLEGDVAMGICATPVMDRALRVILVLAGKPGFDPAYCLGSNWVCRAPRASTS